VTVTAGLDAPGYLVLSDVLYPGWTALIDGKPASMLAANLAFRAVLVPPGNHTIEFLYSPPGFKPGAVLTTVTLLAGIGLGLRKRKTSGGDPQLRRIR